jgi:hypothetical protein
VVEGAAGRAEERRRLARAASLLVLAVAAIAVLAGTQTPDQPKPAPRADPAPVRGLEAELVHRRRELESGQVAWRTRWRLCWRPQEGVRDYVLTIVTSEGVDPAEHSTRAPCYALTVASGTAPAGEVPEQRNAQLDLVESNLSVSVAARMPGGPTGPPSADIPVGPSYRSGG